MTMNTEQKTAWLEALRSGEYAQGSRALATDIGDGQYAYCCLGVLCDLAVKAGVIEAAPSLVSPDVLAFTADGDELGYGFTAALPPEVSEWAGLLERNPSVKYVGGNSSLASLNDGWYPPLEGEPIRLSFTEIADVIDAQL